VYCKDSNHTQAHANVTFTFLDFTFRPRSALSPQGRRFTSVLPGVGGVALKRMRQTVKRWRLSQITPGTWLNWRGNATPPCVGGEAVSSGLEDQERLPRYVRALANDGTGWMMGAG